MDAWSPLATRSNPSILHPLMTTGSLSKELFNASMKLIPGGVNSPVRAFHSVGGEPLFIEKGKGAMLVDADGQEYIDYMMSWGALLHGHAHKEITGKIAKALERGTSFGAPTGFELELAKLVTDALPAMDMIRLVNSGTEATMSAIRLARGHTNRKKIIKFDGCYHGHVDALLVEAGSGVATLGIPGSPGIPEEVTAHTISLPFNDLEAVREVFQKDPQGFAAVIVEPVAGNMGVIPPQEGFLQGLRTLTEEHGTLLILDEVMTGFRVAWEGAQGMFQVTPDLTCLGKIIGGGLPVGAYGGKREIMEKIAPAGPIYQAGTLSGNPIAMAAGTKALKLAKEPETYQRLDYRSQYLTDELKKRADAAKIPMTINRVGSMFTLFFSEKPITDLQDVKESNLRRFAKYFNAMLEEGVYFPPSPFEACFLSTAHGETTIEKTLAAHEKALKKL